MRTIVTFEIISRLNAYNAQTNNAFFQSANSSMPVSYTHLHGHQSTLCPCAMADLAAAGAARCAGLAHRVRREVVVMDIALGLLIGQVVHEMCIRDRKQTLKIGIRKT